MQESEGQGELELAGLFIPSLTVAVGGCAACGEPIFSDEETGYDVWDRLVHAGCRSLSRWTDPAVSPSGAEPALGRG
jgi:hypothetical protein